VKRKKERDVGERSEGVELAVEVFGSEEEALK
jgi:hypothetical protein